MDTIQNTLENLNITLLEVLNNQYVSAVLLIFFIFYASMAAPALPSGVARLFDFTLFKVFILALILFINNFNPTVAIIVAIGFFISLQTLSRYHVFDMAKEVSSIRKLMGMKADEESESSEGEEAEDTFQGSDNYGLNMETQVSGMSARTPYYQGPQGMKHPVGFSGVEEGETF